METAHNEAAASETHANGKMAGFCKSLLGDSLRVEQRTLTPLVLVRIQVPQPFPFSLLEIADLFRLLVRLCRAICN